MKINATCFCLSFCIALSVLAQQPAPVPRLTYFSGVVKDAAGTPQTGVAGIAFALYEEQQGGAALWTEIQNVPLDDQGRYTALLGSMQPDGLPQDLFSSGKARWLGVTPQLPGAVEQPRILLVGVPYALKAADAGTLGGLPASAFLKAPGDAPPAAPTAGASDMKPGYAAATSPNTACAKITGTGTATANQIALFTAACNVGPASALYESGANVGIGNHNPASPLDVAGLANFRDGLSVNGNVTASGGAVNVSGIFNADIGNANNGSLTPGIQFGNPTGEGMASKRTAGGNQYGLDFYTDFTPRLSVTNAGSVGVGTESPAALLEVAGNMKISGTGSTLTFPDGTTQSTAGNPAGVVGVNPLQVALLKWFPAYQSGASFSVGSGPIAVAFDGSNIWVANAISSNVTKLRASDGANLGKFSVGSYPQAVTFDGANIWVANGDANNVTKLRASDGANLGTFAVGTGPGATAFDGSSIWVANAISNTVTKLRASDGACVGTCTFAVASEPYGVAFDGVNVWVTNYGSNTVTKLRASDGTNLGSFSVGAGPVGVAFDGANVWVANNSGNTVTKLSVGDGTNLGTFTVGSKPYGVAFDGANIWVANNGSNTVTKLRASDGTNLGVFSTGQAPGGLAFDGANIWVTNGNSETVSKL